MTPLPQYVQIEPVGQCNLRCRMCPIAYRTDGPAAFLPFETFTRLLDEFEGVRELHLQGLGEPLMHPRFFDMVRHAAERGIRVTTNSNLTLLTSRRARQCVDSGLHTLHVSVDAVTPEKYEQIRTGAKWRWLASGLERLLSAKGRSPVPHLHLVMVLMRLNLDELPRVVLFAAGNQFEEVFVQHLCHDFGEPALPDRYTPLRDFVALESLTGWPGAEGIFAESRALAARAGIRLRLPQLEEKPQKQCDWPWRGAYVSWQGLAMPCCMVSTPDRVNFGNMAKEGVEAIWNGAGYQEFRRALQSDHPPDVCRSCSLYRGTF